MCSVHADLRDTARQRGNTICFVFPRSIEDIGHVANRVLVVNNAHAEMYNGSPRRVLARQLSEPMGLRLHNHVHHAPYFQNGPAGQRSKYGDEAVDGLLPLLKKRKEKTTILSDVTIGQVFPASPLACTG